MTRLLLLGASGVDWASFSAKARAGDLPGLAALAARGRLAPLAGAQVTSGPGAWASLASGVEPQAHGVWRPEEEWPGGLRPTSKASWRVPPLWARLSAGGISTGSVAWPASAPGEGWAGLHVDERFAEASGLFREDWALPLRCASPKPIRRRGPA